MAQFPTRESDIMNLANAMRSGYEANPTIFPHADPATLFTVLTEYQAARLACNCAKSAAILATDEKDTALHALTDKMTLELKQSEVDVAARPDALRLIGWAPEAAAESRTPGQPRSLAIAGTGPGIVELDWKAAVPGDGGAARVYVIQRREQPAGGGAFSTWAQVAIALEPNVQLLNQPRFQQLEYRVLASNLAGDSNPTNSIAVTT